MNISAANKTHRNKWSNAHTSAQRWEINDEANARSVESNGEMENTLNADTENYRLFNE